MSLQENIENLSIHFSNCKEKESLYKKIIELGYTLPKMSDKNKIDENLVVGCQSRTFLFTTLKDNCIQIEMDSNALISKGICSILFLVYNNVQIEKVLKHEPNFIKDLKIQQSLSLNRSNGLIQILNKIKKDALQLYLKRSHQ